MSKIIMAKSNCDGVILSDSDGTLMRENLKNVRDLAKNVGIRDSLLHRQNSLKTIQDYTKKLLKLTTKDEVIIFEDEKVKLLEWGFKIF